MSQHKFITMHNGSEIVVTMGWDRPLQGFFMFIMEVDSKPLIAGETENEDEPVYLFNCLDQHDAHPREISGYLFELIDREIVIPQEMLNELLSDSTHNVGNKIVEHRYVNGKYVREQTL